MNNEVLMGSEKEPENLFNSLILRPFECPQGRTLSVALSYALSLSRGPVEEQSRRVRLVPSKRDGTRSGQVQRAFRGDLVQ